MPRGRKGLSLVPPEQVVKAIGIRSDRWVARQFGVVERTVRRWKRTGLPLWYGRHQITRDDWRAFEARQGITPSGAVSVVKPQGTEETGSDRPAAPIPGELTNRNRSRLRGISPARRPAGQVSAGRPAKRTKAVRPRRRTGDDRHLSNSSRSGRAC